MMGLFNCYVREYSYVKQQQVQWYFYCYFVPIPLDILFLCLPSLPDIICRQLSKCTKLWGKRGFCFGQFAAFSCRWDITILIFAWIVLSAFSISNLLLEKNFFVHYRTKMVLGRNNVFVMKQWALLWWMSQWCIYHASIGTIILSWSNGHYYGECLNDAFTMLGTIIVKLL